MMNEAEQIILLGRKLSKAEELHLQEKLPDRLLLIDPSYLPNKKALSTISEVVEKVDTDLSERHLQRTIEFGHKKIINGKSIAERLTEDGSSDWYYLRFSLFQRSRAKMIIAEEVNAVLDRIDSKAHITLYHSLPIPKGLLNRKIDQQAEASKAKKALPLDFLFNYAFLFLYRALFGNWGKTKLINSAKKMIIANPYLEQELIELGSGKLKIGDPHLQNLIDLSLKEKDFIYLTQLRPPSLEANHQLKISSYFRKRPYDPKSFYFEPYLLKTYFSKGLKQAHQKIKSFIGELEQLRGELNAEDAYLLNVLIGMKRTLFLAKWRELAAERLWERTAVKKVLTIDEHSLQNRSILVSAKQKKVQTYALQHGAISRANIAYRFIDSDVPFSPWPDLTFIRGEHTRIQLEQNQYPSSKLELVGHLRTDIIPYLKARSKGSSTVIYATQPMPPADHDLKRRQLIDFLKLVKRNPNDEFLIKPHPNESELNEYYSLESDPKYPNLKVANGNLYLLLAECEVLITYYSTVGLEAIYFDKEVICLDYEKRDYQGYHTAEVAHRALNGDELIDIYQDIRSGELSTDPEKKKNFIAARAYKIDGKASERVMQRLN
jgi:hypothetical protein